MRSVPGIPKRLAICIMCCRWLRISLYILYVFVALTVCPVVFYVAISAKELDKIYWFSFYFTSFTMVLAIFEGLARLTRSICFYCAHKRERVWNVELGRYQLVADPQLKLFNSIGSPTLLAKDNRGLPVASAFGDSVVVIRPPEATVTIIIPAYLANESMVILDSLAAVANMHYHGNMVNVILAYSDNLPPSVEEIKTSSVSATLKEAAINSLIYGDSPAVTAVHLGLSAGIPVLRPAVSQTAPTEKPWPQDILMRQLMAMQSTFIERGKRLILFPAAGCKTKGETINKVLSAIQKGEIPRTLYVGFLDADHMPEHYAMALAIAKLEKTGASILQGRCVIRNNECLLGSMVGVEYDLIYVLNQYGSDIMRGDSIFGGSNAWMRMDTLLSLGLNTECLSDDVEFSVRATIQGYTITYDSDVISYEMAPLRWSDLLRQRIRWAQGWLQVTLEHSCRLLCSMKMTCCARFFFLRLLLYREILFYAASQMVPVFFASIVRGTFNYNYYLLWGSVASLLLTPAQLLVTSMYLALEPDRIAPQYYRPLGFCNYFWFIPFSLFYNYLKFVLVVVAHVMEAGGYRSHWITRRK